MSDINHLIDRLERLLNDSWRMPLSTYLVVNEDEFLDIIDQMRTAIPREVKEGEKIQRERERIVAQAEEEAERLLQLAQEDAAKLVDQHEVIRMAEQRGKTIIERAQREAEVLKGEADEYVGQVLLSLDSQISALEQQIADLRTTVRNGLSALMHEGEEEVQEAG